jgi:hypothetical protein
MTQAGFKGSTMHTLQFTSAANRMGNEQPWSVLAPMVGTALSYRTKYRHHIAQDLFNHGIDITMYVSSSGLIYYLINYYVSESVRICDHNAVNGSKAEW